MEILEQSAEQKHRIISYILRFSVSFRKQFSSYTYLISFDVNIIKLDAVYILQTVITTLVSNKINT